MSFGVNGYTTRSVAWSVNDGEVEEGDGKGFFGGEKYVWRRNRSRWLVDPVESALGSFFVEGNIFGMYGYG